MPYGLTLEGFYPKTLEIIREELDAALRSVFGLSLPLGDKTLLGVINGIMAEQYATLWELAEAVNASQDPDQASGAGLEALALLTGTFRGLSISSTVTLTLTGTPATLVASGSTAATDSTAVSFATNADATIAALTAWTITTAYVAGDRVTNASRAYQCTIAGTSAGAGGPTTTANAIVDGTVTWTYLGDGTGAIDVLALSVDDGPLEGTARDIIVITTPVGGWSSVINLLDAVPGHNADTDEELRLRREDELTAPGTSTADAIRTALLQIGTVTSATVFVNDTDVTDVDGVPPHSIEALVRGSGTAEEDQIIWNTLFANVAAGIGTYGPLHQGTVTDSSGVDHTVSFSRPTEITIHIAVTLKYDAATYPTDGDVQVASAIVAYGDSLSIGRDAVATSLGAQAFKIAGVLDVPRSGSLGGTLIRIIASPISDATIVITSRQLAVYDTSRVAVISTPATP